MGDLMRLVIALLLNALYSHSSCVLWALALALVSGFWMWSYTKWYPPCKWRSAFGDVFWSQPTCIAWDASEWARYCPHGFGIPMVLGYRWKWMCSNPWQGVLVKRWGISRSSPVVTQVRNKIHRSSHASPWLPDTK